MLGKLPVQAAQNLQPFLMAMPTTVTFTDHVAVQHVQRRKQRGPAIAFVVVRPAPAVSDPTRESPLFIQTQHQRLVGWVQIRPHHIAQLFQESRISRHLKGGSGAT